MSTHVEPSRSSAPDVLKWVLVVAIVATGVVGNSYFRDESLLYRVLALVALALVAFGIASLTTQGQAFLSLAREARAEIRRVVWPDWPETRQTTLIVVVLVVIAASFLGLLDWVLGLGVTSLIG